MCKAKPHRQLVLQKNNSLLLMSHPQRHQSMQKGWAKNAGMTNFVRAGRCWKISAGFRQTRKWQCSAISVWKLSRKNGYSRGSRNYPYSAIAEHAMSVSHKAAVATTSTQTSMVPHSESACAGEKECLQLLRTVLWMVKNNIPANNFVSLLELQKMNGAQSLKTEEIYTHYSSVSQMEQCLVNVTKEEINPYGPMRPTHWPCLNLLSRRQGRSISP